MNQSDAINKIRKLLNRNGRTEAEADTASILAAALAEKHGIDIAGLDQADEQRRNGITHREIKRWVKSPPEADYAHMICKDYFEVSPFTQVVWMERLIFVGTEWHIEIAAHVFDFLLHEFRWQWNRRRGRCRNRKQFMFGIYIALDSKLHSRFATPVDAPAGIEISWKGRRKKYIEDNFGEMTSSSIEPATKRSAAIHHGWRAGRDIEIRAGINGGNQKQPEALPGLSGRLLEDRR